MAVKVGFVRPDARANLTGDKLHDERGTIKYAYAEIETGLRLLLNLEINRCVYGFLTGNINLAGPSESFILFLLHCAEMCNIVSIFE